MGVSFKEYRCESCQKLFFKGILVEGTIELKCRHCHTVNTIQKSDFNELLCLISPCPHRVTLHDPPTPSS